MTGKTIDVGIRFSTDTRRSTVDLERFYAKTLTGAKEISAAFFKSKETLTGLQAALAKQKDGSEGFKFLSGEVRKAQKEVDTLDAKLKQIGSQTAAARSRLAGAQVNNLVGGIGEAARARQAQLDAPARQVAADRALLGVRPNAQIQAEIAAARAAFDRLRASGVLSAAEINQAYAATRARIADLTAQTAGAGSRLVAVVGPILTLFGGLGLFSRFVQNADAVNSYTARLKIASDGNREFAQAQEDVIAIARRTRAPLEATATLYARLAPAVRDAGGSQRDTAKLTEFFNKTLAITGATAQEQSSAILQFAQALGAGALRGEEFNAINEAAPEFMRQLAISLGVPRGALKRLAEEGKLTADVLIAAANKQSDAVDKKFAQLPDNLDRSRKLLRTEAALTFAQLDKSLGASAALGGGIRLLAENLGGLLTAGTAVGGALLIAFGPQLLAALAAAAARVRLVETAALGVGARLGPIIALTALIGTELSLRQKEAELKALQDQAKKTLDDLASIAEANQANSNLQILSQAEFEKLSSEERATYRERLDSATKYYSAVLEQAARADDADSVLMDGLSRRLAALKNAAQNFQPSSADAIEKSAKVFDAGAEALKKSLTIINQDFETKTAAAQFGLEQQFAKNLIGYEQYFREKAGLEIAALDKQVQNFRAEQSLVDQQIARIGKLATDAKDPAAESAANKELNDLRLSRAEIESKINGLLSRQRQVGLEADQSIQQSTRQTLAARAELSERLLRAQGKDAEARKAALGREIAEQQRVSQTDPVKVGLLSQILDIEGARIDLDEARRQFSEIQSKLAAEEQVINVRRENGLLSASAAQSQILEKQRAAIPLLQAQADIVGSLAGKFPQAATAATEYKAVIESLGQLQDRTFAQIRSAGQDATATLFNDFITGSKSAEDAFKSLADSVLSSSARIASQRIAEDLFDSFIPKGAGGGGGFLASILSFFNHEGGIAGVHGVRRPVPALAFAGAPRLHDGGLVGLKSDEVPAILQRGEEVLTRNDPRHALNGGGPAITINVSTPDARSFRENEGQISASLAQALSRAQNRNR